MCANAQDQHYKYIIWTVETVFINNLNDIIFHWSCGATSAPLARKLTLDVLTFKKIAYDIILCHDLGHSGKVEVTGKKCKILIRFSIFLKKKILFYLNIL